MDGGAAPDVRVRVEREHGATGWREGGLIWELGRTLRRGRIGGGNSRLHVRLRDGGIHRDHHVALDVGGGGAEEAEAWDPGWSSVQELRVLGEQNFQQGVSNSRSPGRSAQSLDLGRHVQCKRCEGQTELNLSARREPQWAGKGEGGQKGAGSREVSGAQRRRQVARDGALSQVHFVFEVMGEGMRAYLEGGDTVMEKRKVVVGAIDLVIGRTRSLMSALGVPA